MARVLTSAAICVLDRRRRLRCLPRTPSTRPPGSASCARRGRRPASPIRTPSRCTTPVSPTASLYLVMELVDGPILAVPGERRAAAPRRGGAHPEPCSTPWAPPRRRASSIATSSPATSSSPRRRLQAGRLRHRQAARRPATGPHDDRSVRRHAEVPGTRAGRRRRRHAGADLYSTGCASTRCTAMRPSARRPGAR